MSVGAIGGILGAISSTWVQRFVGEGRSIAVSAALSGAWFLLSGAVVYNVTQVSFRQRLCPTPRRGR